MSYFERMLKPKQRNKYIGIAKRILKKRDFDLIVGRGGSGISGASILSYALNKELVIVRKSLDNHDGCRLASSSDIKYNSTSLNYIIVDDFICSGKTIKEIKKQMPAHHELVGAFLYGTDMGEQCRFVDAKSLEKEIK